MLSLTPVHHRSNRKWKFPTMPHGCLESNNWKTSSRWGVRASTLRKLNAQGHQPIGHCTSGQFKSKMSLSIQIQTSFMVTSPCQCVLEMFIPWWTSWTNKGDEVSDIEEYKIQIPTSMTLLQNATFDIVSLCVDSNPRCPSKGVWGILYCGTYVTAVFRIRSVFSFQFPACVFTVSPFWGFYVTWT